MSNLTRQQLYDKIRQSSKDEYILAEMIRLGFWNESEGAPSLPAQMIQERGDLERQLNALFKKQRIYADPQKALKEMHKQRKAEAKQKREETKKRKNRERHDRAQKQYQSYTREITDLGPNYSKLLKNKAFEIEKLNRYHLPALSSSKELATAMGISIHELRFLTYHRNVSKTTHYQRFQIAKKRGGFRDISAPMPRMKRAQYWILGNILEKLPLHSAVHGFTTDRSILTNASPHLGQDIVINIDLKNFFPTITYNRVRGLFKALGYSNHIATLLALLTTEPATDMVAIDGDHYYIDRGERFLPQGAPSSPALTNIICKKLDKRLQGVAQKLNLNYTRYADDLTFSGDRDLPVKKLLYLVDQIVSDEGFLIHPEKTRIMRSGQQQEVTGIVVNHKCSISRKKLKQFRALLYQIERDGLRGKKWGSGPLIPSIEGFANFVAMVKPEQGKKFQQQIKEIKYQFGYRTPRQPQSIRVDFKKSSVEGKAPKTDWWTPIPKPAPVVEQTTEEIKEERQQQQATTTTPTNTATTSPRRNRQQNSRNTTTESSKDKYKRFFKRD